MMTEEQCESLQRRREFQDQFTMCWNFQWHLTTERCDCTATDED